MLPGRRSANPYFVPITAAEERAIAACIALFVVAGAFAFLLAIHAGVVDAWATRMIVLAEML